MDKRTLELAAKAAGIECEWKLGANYKQILVLSRNKQRFDPVNDTYDFFQLAEKIRATVDFKNGIVSCEPTNYQALYTCFRSVKIKLTMSESAKDYSCIQEALVHLAARIGEAME